MKRSKVLEMPPPSGELDEVFEDAAVWFRCALDVQAHLWNLESRIIERFFASPDAENEFVSLTELIENLTGERRSMTRAESIEALKKWIGEIKCRKSR